MKTGPFLFRGIALWTALSIGLPLFIARLVSMESTDGITFLIGLHVTAAAMMAMCSCLTVAAIGLIVGNVQLPFKQALAIHTAIIVSLLTNALYASAVAYLASWGDVWYQAVFVLGLGASVFLGAMTQKLHAPDGAVVTALDQRIGFFALGLLGAGFASSAAVSGVHIYFAGAAAFLLSMYLYGWYRFDHVPDTDHEPVAAGPR